MSNLAVRDTVSEASHRIRPDAAAISHNGSQYVADVIRFLLILLAGRHELEGEVQLVIHLNEQLRQLNDPQTLKATADFEEKAAV